MRRGEAAIRGGGLLQGPEVTQSVMFSYLISTTEDLLGRAIMAVLVVGTALSIVQWLVIALAAAQ